MIGDGVQQGPESQSRRPLVLCLLDGFGEREAREGNALKLAKTGVIDGLRERFGVTHLAASGEAVGLDEGRKGSGALGAEAIGTGRIPAPIERRIDQAIAEKKLGENAVLKRAIWIAHDRKCPLHVFLPLGEASSHAPLEHLRALLRMTDLNDVKVTVHVFLEQSPSAPKSAWRRLDALEVLLDGKGTIGTVSGGMYAMDRSGQWGLSKLAFAAIVRGEAPQKETASDALSEAYEKGRTDFTIEPVRIGAYDGQKGSFMADFSSGKPLWQWFGEEVALSLSVRPDRLHQLASMFTRTNVPAEVEEFLTERGKAIFAFDEYGLLSWTEIDPAFEKVLSAFPHEPVKGTFVDALAAAGKSVARVAGADRAKHVTRFFDGGFSASRANESVVIVPHEEDEGSVAEAAEKVVAEGKHDVVIVSFGRVDRAARQGKLEAAVAAVESIDAAVGRLAESVKAKGGVLAIVGTHGAAEEMLGEDGKPTGSHTTNPVPFVLADFAEARGAGLASGGQLSDVAPTLLDALGLSKPEGMTGASLRRVEGR